MVQGGHGLRAIVQEHRGFLKLARLKSSLHLIFALGNVQQLVCSIVAATNQGLSPDCLEALSL